MTWYTICKPYYGRGKYFMKAYFTHYSYNMFCSYRHIMERAYMSYLITFIIISICVNSIRAESTSMSSITL